MVTPKQASVNHSVLRSLNRHNDRNMSIRLWNARSVRKKTIAISENIIENDVDLFVVTETWLTEEDPVVIGELLPPPILIC